MTKISIIIPVLNEAKTIKNLLIHLLKNSTQNNIADIIIVDGGSNDNTVPIIKHFIGVEKSNIQLIISQKGRARQMNAGAGTSKGEILYFLHADSFPPKYFDSFIINEVNQNHLAGCFRLKFDHNHWWLHLAGWLTQFSWRACRGGDQSQFITKKLFYTIGGFNEDFTIYEDNILINELYKRKQFRVINKKIITSARLYERHGIWRLQYHFWVIYIKKWLGADAHELLSYYKKYIG